MTKTGFKRVRSMRLTTHMCKRTGTACANSADSRPVAADAPRQLQVLRRNREAGSAERDELRLLVECDEVRLRRGLQRGESLEGKLPYLEGKLSHLTCSAASPSADHCRSVLKSCPTSTRSSRRKALASMADGTRTLQFFLTENHHECF